MTETTTGRRLKILFTEGSSTSSREALYCLGPRHSIDILDPSRFCQSRFSRFVRRWHRCPPYAKDPLGYLRFVVRLLRREKYDVLFPTHEQVYLLSRVREPISQLTATIVPSFESLSQVYDKASFIRLLQKLDVPHPPTTIVRTRDELDHDWDFPCYVKHAHGTAGQAVWRVENRDEVRKVAERCEAAGMLDGQQEILVQKAVTGVQRGAGGIFQNGRMVSGGCGEAAVIGVGGAAMQKMPDSYDEERVEHVRQVGEHIHWHGPFSMASIYDPQEDRENYIEACPRIGESFPSLLAGGNACETMVRIALGEEIEPEPPGRIARARSHQTFLILVTKALQGQGRFSIARELIRALRRSGMYAGSEDELTRWKDDWLSVVPAAAVSALMLAYPRAAQWLVSTTVENYSLPGGAAERIRNIPQEELDACFD